MWRIGLLLVFVLILDFALFYVGGVATSDMNMRQLRDAVNFTRQTQDALDATLERTSIEQYKIEAWFGAGIVFVTLAGFFIAGRWFERHRSRQTLPAKQQ